MKPAWFRRPDGVLVAAQHADQLALFLRRGYVPVKAEAAEVEVAAGTQAELNEVRREADRNAREPQLAAARQRTAEERRTAALRDRGPEANEPPKPESPRKPREDSGRANPDA